MSGTSSPLFRIEDILGDDILGDRETEGVNEALTDVGETLDDADQPLDDLADDAAQAADDADEPVDDLADDAERAADDADEPLEDLADDAAQAADDADEPVDDLADDAERAADDAGEQLDDLADEFGQAADDADEPLDDLAEDVEQAIDEAEDELDDLPEDVTGAGAGSVLAWVTPVNNSGAQALAQLRLDGDALRVTIEGSGFTPGEAHAIALSGLGGGQASRLPTVADDADGDGTLDATEAASAAGPVLLELGNPVADAEGNISFSGTVTPDAATLAALETRLDGRLLAIEGLDEAGPDTGYQADIPAAGGLTHDVPGQLGTVLNVLTALSPDLAGDVFRGLLDAQAPYTLAPDGSGPISAEDPDVAGTDATRFVSLIQPANNSGVFGAAVVTFDEAAGTVAVDLELDGLTPGAEHPMHIHGFADDRASLVPNLQLDTDTDGFLEASEAMGVIGPVLLGFTTDGEVSDATLIGDFPVADADGRVSLEQTYDFDLSDPGEAQIFEEFQDRFAGRQIEVHGLTTTAAQGEGTGGEVNGEAGYQPGLSVASGALLPVEGVSGALAAGVGYVIQAGLSGEEIGLQGFLDALAPAFGGDSLLG
ncbi:hypothetical protein [Falsiroseomonas sp.]|uniref:hypothetical protein n=1 Tax=Falsiroseomonas sp. TaxID=2870721 RepID=UPI0035681B00